MKLLLAAPLFAALAIPALPATAQTSVKTEVKNDTDVKDGVVTRTHKVTHVAKRKTSRPKKILGVKVGHKTATTKTVRETSTSSDGDMTTSVKTTH